jgi:hypothetical protein
MEEGDDIKVVAQKVDDADPEFNGIAPDTWVKVTPGTEQANNLAKTLLVRQDQLGSNFTQFANRDLFSYKLLGTAKDPILGTGWGAGFRSPIYDKTVLASIPALAVGADTAIPIQYFSRDLKGGETEVPAFTKANKMVGDASTQLSIDNARRLDDFEINVREITKIQLKAGDPVYVLSYDQVPLLKTSGILTANQCQYLSMKLTPATYDPANPTHAVNKSNAKNGCSSGLTVGAVYKPVFDQMITVISNPPIQGNIAQPVFGGARKSRRYRMIQNPFSLTKHNRRRFTKNNHRRNRYNRTKRG